MYEIQVKGGIEWGCDHLSWPACVLLTVPAVACEDIFGLALDGELDAFAQARSLVNRLAHRNLIVLDFLISIPSARTFHL